MKRAKFGSSLRGNGAGMTAEPSREVGDIPPDRQTEEKPSGADPDTDQTSPEHQPPDPGRGPSDAPDPGSDEQGPSGAPPDSVPGDQGRIQDPGR